MCDCFVHEKKCPTYPTSLSVHAATIILDDTFDECDDVCDREILGINKPLIVSCAGVSCIALSSQCKREKSGHASEVPHHVWVCERTVLAERGLEHVAFLECVWGYPVEARLCVDCSATHLTIYIRTGAFCLGWPHDRDRVQAAMLNRRSIHWLGPLTQDEIEADFKRRFYRRPMVGGSALLTYDGFSRNEYDASLGNNRLGQKYADYTVEDVESWSSDELLMSICPPGMLERYKAWQRVRAQKHVSLPQRDFMCDLDHWPSNAQGGDGGHTWPTQLTHGTVMAMKNSEEYRIAMDLEHLGALGLPCHPWNDTHRVVAAFNDLGYKPIHVKKLAGNGMHLHVQACWYFYILSNIAPREYFVPGSLQPPDPWDLMQDEKEDDVQMSMEGEPSEPPERARVQELLEAALSSEDDDLIAGHPNGPPRFAAFAAAFAARGSDSRGGQGSSSSMHGSVGRPPAQPSPLGGTDAAEQEAAEELTDAQPREITAPSPSPDPPRPSTCFACDKKRKPRSSLCHEHSRIHSIMQREAARTLQPQAMREFQQAMRVQPTAAQIICDWERENVDRW